MVRDKLLISKLRVLLILLTIGLNFSAYADGVDLGIDFSPPHSFSHDQDKFRRVQAYIQEQSVIRVGISDAPGSGHQSAGATVIARLREVGYKGLIEVVYEESTANKLEYLIPPFLAKLGSPQFHPQKNLHFVSVSQLDRSLTNTVDLGLMGADDSDWAPALLNVKNLMVFQPLNWKEPPILKRIGQEQIVFHDFKRFGFGLSLPSFPFFEDQMSHISTLRDKINGLKVLDNERSNLDIAPIYGHRISQGWQLVRYIGGLRWAINHHPYRFRDKIVVAVLSELPFDTKLFEDHSELQPIQYRKIQDLQTDHIRNLAPREILVVNVGVVAKTVFEYLYRISTISPVVEGKNSINLMRLLGTPYLPSSFFESYHFRDDELTNSEFVKLSYAEQRAVVYAAFGMWDTSMSFAEATRNIGPFIADGKNPDSPLTKLFAKFRIKQDSIENDKFIQCLFETIRVIQVPNTSGLMNHKNQFTCTTLLLPLLADGAIQ